jgi:hypothetical protein
MRYLIRSRRGRAHLAYRADTQWVGICGSLIVHTIEQTRAVSAAELPSLDGVCFYCLAIGSEASMIERRAVEAVLDAGSVLPLSVGV